MTATSRSAELLALEAHCDRAYDRLLVLCGTRNDAPRWDDITTLLRERERLLLDRRLAVNPDEDGVREALELLEERPAAALRALVIEECAKIAEKSVCGHTLTPNGLAREDQAEIIAESIRALSTAGEPKRCR